MTTLAAPRSAKPNKTAPLHVLVADDHPANQMVLQSILGRIGCALTITENGRDAVDACEAGAFDVVLMDLRMPVMDGIEATRAIRARERESGRARTPILLCSADCEHAREAADAGADGYLVKPLSPRVLIESISAALGVSSPARTGA